jgi:hypothetical protein
LDFEPSKSKPVRVTTSDMIQLEMILDDHRGLVTPFSFFLLGCQDGPAVRGDSEI